MQYSAQFDHFNSEAFVYFIRFDVLFLAQRDKVLPQVRQHRDAVIGLIQGYLKGLPFCLLKNRLKMPY